MYLAGNDAEKIQEVKNHFGKKFKIKDLGEPKNYLGMKIERDRKNKIMKVSQPEYTEKVLERFNMLNCNARTSPMVTRQVKKRDEKSQEMSKIRVNVPYREAIGSLLYLAGVTRPDISFAVNYLARKQQNPTEDDWEDIKRIFRYLKATKELGITFKAKGDELEVFTDSSFSDNYDSTSTGGYVVKLFGDPISWRSYKQKLVTTSTCQAEYFTMSDACSEIISLDKAIRDMIGKTLYPVKIWCDNQSAGKCTQMEGNHRLKSFDYDIETIKQRLAEREITGHKRTMSEKHGDFIKSCVVEGKAVVKWVESKENPADIFTKPLPSPAHIYLRDNIMNNS